ncbi:MAG TPA: ribosome recycling factor [Patescibacteria group bacterium]|nr:ribosome recycling factor [Patescibacteria group bacterium]
MDGHDQAGSKEKKSIIAVLIIFFMSTHYQEEFQKIIDHYIHAISTVRTGRANPAIVDNIEVESYGAKMKLRELAAISVPEPKVLQIEPWDKNIAKEIEKAIIASNIGLTPNVSGSVIRLVLPAMTEERRKLLIKQLMETTESARVGIRRVRDEILKAFKEEKSKGEMTEDQFFQKSKEVQNSVDLMNARIKELLEAKEKEIMTI